MPLPRYPLPRPRQSASQQEGAAPSSEAPLAEEGVDRQSVHENPALLNMDGRGVSDDRIREAMRRRAAPGQTGAGVISPYENLAPDLAPRGGESDLTFNQITLEAAVWEEKFTFHPGMVASRVQVWVKTHNIYVQFRTSVEPMTQRGAWGDELFLEEGSGLFERRWLTGLRARNAEAANHAVLTLTFVTAPQHLFTHQIQR